jgi:hypothetical protein
LKTYKVILLNIKNDAWFTEKYDPEVLDALEKERKENIKKKYQEFIRKT